MSEVFGENLKKKYIIFFLVFALFDILDIVNAIFRKVLSTMRRLSGEI